MAFRPNCSWKKLETNCHLRFSELISSPVFKEHVQCKVQDPVSELALKTKRNYHIIHILPSTVWQGHHKVSSHKVQINFCPKKDYLYSYLHSPKKSYGTKDLEN